MRAVYRTTLGALLLLGYIQVLLLPAMPWVYYWTHKPQIIAQQCVNLDRPAMACDGKCYLKHLLRQANGLVDSLPSQSTTPPVQLNLEAYPLHDVPAPLQLRMLASTARLQHSLPADWRLPAAVALQQPCPPPWPQA